MLPQDLERTLERYGYERLRYPKYVLVRSETPLREGDFFSPLRPVLKVLPDGTATLNHEGEGSHVGITYSQKFATMAYCLAVFGYKSFNQFNMKINDELRAVTVAKEQDDKIKVTLICVFPNDSVFRFNRTGLYDKDGKPLNEDANEIEKRLFS